MATVAMIIRTAIFACDGDRDAMAAFYAEHKELSASLAEAGRTIEAQRQELGRLRAELSTTQYDLAFRDARCEGSDRALLNCIRDRKALRDALKARKASAEGCELAWLEETLAVAPEASHE